MPTNLTEADLKALAEKLDEIKHTRELREGNFVATRSTPSPHAGTPAVITEAVDFEQRRAVSEMSDPEREAYAREVWAKVLPVRRNA